MSITFVPITNSLVVVYSDDVVEGGLKVGKRINKYLQEPKAIYDYMPKTPTDDNREGIDLYDHGLGEIFTFDREELRALAPWKIGCPASFMLYMTSEEIKEHAIGIAAQMERAGCNVFNPDGHGDVLFPELVRANSVELDEIYAITGGHGIICGSYPLSVILQEKLVPSCVPAFESGDIDLFISWCDYQKFARELSVEVVPIVDYEMLSNSSLISSDDDCAQYIKAIANHVLPCGKKLQFVVLASEYNLDTMIHVLMDFTAISSTIKLIAPECHVLTLRGRHAIAHGELVQQPATHTTKRRVGKMRARGFIFEFGKFEYNHFRGQSSCDVSIESDRSGIRHMVDATGKSENIVINNQDDFDSLLPMLEDETFTCKYLTLVGLKGLTCKLWLHVRGELKLVKCTGALEVYQTPAISVLGGSLSITANATRAFYVKSAVLEIASCKNLERIVNTNSDIGYRRKSAVDVTETYVAFDENTLTFRDTAPTTCLVRI